MPIPMKADFSSRKKRLSSRGEDVSSRSGDFNSNREKEGLLGRAKAVNRRQERKENERMREVYRDRENLKVIERKYNKEKI